MTRTASSACSPLLSFIRQRVCPVCRLACVCVGGVGELPPHTTRTFPLLRESRSLCLCVTLFKYFFLLSRFSHPWPRLQRAAGRRAAATLV